MVPIIAPRLMIKLLRRPVLVSIAEVGPARGATPRHIAANPIHGHAVIHDQGKCLTGADTAREADPGHPNDTNRHVIRIRDHALIVHEGNPMDIVIGGKNFIEVTLVVPCHLDADM